MEEAIRLASAAVPLISLTALAVAVIIFAKSKGNIDALKDAAQTYRTLAEAYEAKITHLCHKIEDLKREVVELKSHIAVQEKATKVAVDEILAGLKRRGV